MGKVDELSRRNDWEKEDESDNKDKVLLKPKWLETKRIQTVEVIVKEVDILEKVRKSEARNDKMIKTMEKIKKAKVKILRDKEQRQKNRIMLKEGKVYVPKDEALRVEIIKLHYNILMKEHEKQQKMTELVTRNFWWPGITREVKQYIEGCNTCQHNKNHTEQLTGKLMPNSIPDKAWTYISVDFITKLLLAQGYNSILVIVDQFTRIVHFVPTTEKTTAEGLVRLFRNNVWQLHGLPKSIISNRDLQFVVGLMRELNRLLEIKTKLLIAFHSQTDKQIEKLKQYL